MVVIGAASAVPQHRHWADDKTQFVANKIKNKAGKQMDTRSSSCCTISRTRPEQRAESQAGAIEQIHCKLPLDVCWCPRAGRLLRSQSRIDAEIRNWKTHLA